MSINRKTGKEVVCMYICIYIYAYTMEYYSATKRNEFESAVVRLMNLEPVTLFEVTKRKTNSIRMWSLEKQCQRASSQRRNGHRHREQPGGHIRGSRGRVS